MAADTYASLSDLRVTAQMVVNDIRELLREKTDLRPLMKEIEFNLGAGSASVKSGAAQLVDTMTAPGEDTAPSTTNITDSSATLTVARYTLERQITDLAGMTGAPDIAWLASSAVESARQTLSTALCGNFGGLSQVVGSSGVNLSVADWYEAIGLNALNLVDGQLFAVLHPRQWLDLQDALRAETAGIWVNRGNVETIYAKMDGFKGDYMGVQVFAHSGCPTADSGANRVGAMFGYGCFGFTEADPRPYLNSLGGAVVSLPAGDMKMAIEVAHVPSQAKVTVTSHYYPAVAELEDLRGVAIKTDA